MSVKPHASPVLHAIDYLLGRLDAEYLTKLRQFGGLQSYPSRLKDPVPADFSTGSVGIGATATIWSAIAHRYVAGHFDVPRGGRQVALIGDAELDEGAIWETLVDPIVPRWARSCGSSTSTASRLTGSCPISPRAGSAAMFEAAGWQTITIKYGRWLRELFARDGRRGAAAPDRPDAQRGVPAAAALVGRPSCASGSRARVAAAARVARLVAELDDEELLRGGPRSRRPRSSGPARRFRAGRRGPDRPTVIFAYTIKAWRLATQGHPANHSALLSAEQWAQLAAADRGRSATIPGRGSPEGTPEARAVP